MTPSATPENGPAAPPRIRGFVETQRPVFVSGWVTDQERPGARLTVTFSLDDVVLGETLAEHHRPDLVMAGIGDGSYGFTFKFAKPQRPDDLAFLEVRARTEDGASARLRRVPGLALPPHPADTRQAGAGPLDEQRPIFEQRPVFVLGARRSGTSAVAHALLDQTRYRGHFEGHLLDVVRSLEGTVERFYANKFMEWTLPDRWTMLGDVSRDELMASLTAGLPSVTARLFPDGWWLDKTPTAEAVWSAPRLARIWPQARFIFMRRRAYENVASQGRKFAHESFRQHCQWWADCMTAWLEVRGAVAGRAIELDQHFVAGAAPQASRVIAELLGLDEAEAAAVAGSLAGKRPERTQAEPGAILAAAGEGWGEEDRASFERICRPAMTAYGYGDGENYFSSDDPKLRWRRL